MNLAREINADLGDAVAALVNIEGFVGAISGLVPIEATWSGEVDGAFEPDEDEFQPDDDELL